MDLLQLLVEYGYLGLFVAAFLAGSVLPFSSEVVMAGLAAAGTRPAGLLLWGTAGNVLGSCLNYYIGTLGREEWIERYAKVNHEKLERGKAYVRRYGAWAGLLAWIPLLGSLITVSLGFLRVNFPLTLATITCGKVVRYWLLLLAIGCVL